MSTIRKMYMLRFVCRCIVLVVSALVCVFSPDTLGIIYGMNFFSEFSAAHLLWAVWMFEMLCQIFPIKAEISIGSHKIFKERFKPVREKINRAGLKEYILSVTKGASKVFWLWCALLTLLGTLYFCGVINEVALFMVSVTFYVCDLICVLFWCPFRLLMKTRCCTTCRIFNWDHFMMFSPLMFIGSFFAQSLFWVAIVILIAWELTILVHPERFWEHSNVSLTCSKCTDKLCTQYCQKLRK